MVTLLDSFIENQINTSGDFSNLANSTTTTLLYFAVAWLFWFAVQLRFE